MSNSLARLFLTAPLRPVVLSAISLGLLGSLGCTTTKEANATAPSAAPQLVYLAPSSGEYRLLPDPASTGSHMVLNLVGPVGTQMRGGMFTFDTDGTKVTWGNPGGTEPFIRPGAALDLGTGTKLLKAQLNGSALDIAIYQKGAALPAPLGSQIIFTVALDLKDKATKGAVHFTNPSAQVMDAAGKPQTIQVAVGNLDVH